MNYRLSVAAAVAVILASVSEWVLIDGAGWLFCSIGAVIVIAAAGIVTRLAPAQAAIAATVLAAAASVPFLTDRSLLVKLAGLVIIGLCAASASRIRAFRPFADTVTYLAALFLYLNLVLASAKSFLFVIPTASSLKHLVWLVGQGTNLAGNSPPVQDISGVILLAAGSIGLAAMVVDLLAVRLRRPAIAGLPLLVLYLAPIATAAKPGGPGSIVTFLLAATGYLVLLSSDGRSRLRGWGRVITVWHYAGEDDRLGGADIQGIAATGRRIGVAAVCAAMIAPFLLPHLNLHRLFARQSGGLGSIEAVLPNPVDELNTLLASKTTLPVLSYQSPGSDPGEYLQVYVLNYDSASHIWSLLPPNPSIAIGVTALSQPAGLAQATPVTQTTTQIKLDNVAGSSSGYNSSLFFLPVPYYPIELSLSGAWSESERSLMIYSGSGSHSGLSYTVTSGQPVITEAEENSKAPIPRDIRDSYLGFKSSVTARLSGIADQITSTASTPFAKARALEHYFQASGGFTYTLKALHLQNSAQGLLTFLTKEKKGSCEQFAFAMAVLARLVGIPSRVAIGFTSGTQTHAGGRWLVTTADAHAWPELYFPTLGWLRFEPTPGGANGQGTAVQPAYATQGESAQSGSTGPSDQLKPTGPPPISGQDSQGHLRAAPPDPVGTVSALPSARHPAPIGAILLGVLAALLLASAVPAATRVIGRRRRWRAAADNQALASAAWQEVCADLADFGLIHRASETPRALARRLCADASIEESAHAAIRRISTVVERTRYAPEPAAADGIHADVRQVRRALARNSSVTTRLRARLFPASTITPILRKFRHSFGQLTGWVMMPSEG
jgi:transglutaminase-like putative cysteine protease